MREIFSLRFFAAVGAVILSFLVVSALVGGTEPVADEAVDASTETLVSLDSLGQLELMENERVFVFAVATLIAHADGKVVEAEVEALDKLSELLGLSDIERAAASAAGAATTAVARAARSQGRTPAAPVRDWNARKTAGSVRKISSFVSAPSVSSSASTPMPRPASSASSTASTKSRPRGSDRYLWKASSETGPQNARVYPHDIHAAAIEQYRREGRWPEAWTPTPPGRANRAFLFHERHMRSDEIRIWNALGTQAPTRVLTLDEGDGTSIDQLERLYQGSERWLDLIELYRRKLGLVEDDKRKFFSKSGHYATFGGGIRYRLARKLGMDVGIDVARGPEETIVYLQFGHAWSRD